MITLLSGCDVHICFCRFFISLLIVCIKVYFGLSYWDIVTYLTVSNSDATPIASQFYTVSHLKINRQFHTLIKAVLDYELDRVWRWRSLSWSGQCGVRRLGGYTCIWGAVLWRVVTVQWVCSDHGLKSPFIRVDHVKYISALKRISYKSSRVGSLCLLIITIQQAISFICRIIYVLCI